MKEPLRNVKAGLPASPEEERNSGLASANRRVSFTEDVAVVTSTWTRGATRSLLSADVSSSSEVKCQAGRVTVTRRQLKLHPQSESTGSHLFLDQDSGPTRSPA